MIHLNVQTPSGYLGTQINGTRVHGFLVMIADDDHQRVFPAISKTLENVAQGGIGGAALLENSITEGSTQMPNRVHFVQLHEDELGLAPIHGIERFDHRSIGPIPEFAARGRCFGCGHHEMHCVKGDPAMCDCPFTSSFSESS